MRRFALAVVLSLPFVGAGVALADDAEMAKKRASEVGLQPGIVLDSSNAGLAKGLLPPEILKHYEKGEYKNEIVAWPAGVGTHGPDFDAQTKRNAESLTLDEKGTIVDKASGKQPPFIYGTPFPNVDSKDPSAPIKSGVCAPTPTMMTALSPALRTIASASSAATSPTSTRSASIRRHPRP